MKPKLWHITVVVVAIGCAWFYISHNYSTRWFDTLFLNGRSTLVLQLPEGGEEVLNATNTGLLKDNTNRLYFVEYGQGGVTKTLIPGTPARDFIETDTGSAGLILKPTAIMPDKTVVWTHREGDTWQLMKYQNGTTTVVTSLPIFDLATYARAYASGTAPSIASVQGYTSDIYRMPFVVHDDHSIGLLDAMVTEGDGTNLKGAEVRYRVIDINKMREREREIV